LLFPGELLRHSAPRLFKGKAVEGISDIKITGIDDKRPPRIKKAPYIDIIFKLSHQAPADWCKDFNDLLSKHPTSPKIKENEGLYIEAWVREPDEIVTLLNLLKTKVAECSKTYIDRIENLARNASNDNDSLSQEGGKQGYLNQVIASLEFD
jgi:hypothetical protein